MKSGFRLGLVSLYLLVAALVLFRGSVPHAYAQPAASTFDPDLSIAQVLNPDGTLNLDKGVTGTVDLSSWEVRLDPLRGPVLARTQRPAHAEDDAREPGRPAFATAMFSGLDYGVESRVHSIAVSRSIAYVGGTFSQICGNAACNSGNTTANRIAKWNGKSWSTLGTGLSNDVLAVAVSGRNVYVGGDFTQVCGNRTCNNIARWNGNTWSALGNGLNGRVRALAVSGRNVYAGGDFTQVCGNRACDTKNTTVNRIARWNGSSWSGLGAGVSSAVSALAVSGSNIYAGGNFMQVCGNAPCSSGNTTVNRIARWNGSSWFGVANGFNSAVFALALSGSDVYVGGPFTQVCGNSACNGGNLTANRIAKWNGSFWSALGNGLSNEVYALALSGSDVYAGGSFIHLCGNSACTSNNIRVNFFAKWNGSNWSALESGVSDFVYALGIRGGDVYLGGRFHTVCGNSICTGPNPIVNQIAAHPCESKPPAPTPIAPPNNQIVTSLTPTLKWKSTPCTDQYKVFVTEDATATLADSATKPFTILQYKTDSLAAGTTFRWYVRACNDEGCTNSKTRKFMTP